MLKKYQLRNGLDVILYPSKKAPVLSAQIWVNTGSADESKGIEGVSHFIEHLVFKGSKKYNVGEIAQKVEASGGQLNAYTSFDQTVFYITLSNEFTETALDMLSQMMGHPLFDKDEINNEREVVIEEIKRSNDSLGRVASQAMFSNVYKKHPYGIPVIGYEKVIQTIKKEEIVSYYKAHYSANNMTLLLVGDYDETKIEQQVEKYFSDMPSYPTNKIKRTNEPEQTKERIKLVNSSFNESRASFSWLTTSATDKDTLALDVLAAVLGQYESSKLIHRLRVKEPCVNFIYASSFTPKDKGMFSIHMGLEDKDFSKASALILEEIGSFLKNSLTTEDIARAVKNFESEDIYSMQTVDGIANHIGQYMFLTGDPLYAKKMLEDLKKISIQDVIEVFKKYLSPERMNLTYVSKDAESRLKDLESFVSNYKNVYQINPEYDFSLPAPEYKQENVKTTTTQNANKVQKETLDSGIDVYLYENNDAPLFNLQLASLGALRQENDSQLGLSNLLSHVWACGGNTISEADLSLRLEEYSSSIHSFSGRNTIGLKLTSLSKYQEEVLPLFFDVYQKGSIDEAILNRERQIIMTAIRNKNDNPAQIAAQNFLKELFSNHPYSKEVEGRLDSLPNIGAKDLVNFKNAHLRKNNISISIVGSFDKKKMLQDLNKNLSFLSQEELKNSNFSFQPPKTDKFTKESSQKEQSHIFYGFAGLTFKDQKKYALMLIDAILAGQGGRLFMELRDKASLAYTVTPLHMEGIDAGYFASYIACSPNKSETALKMLKEEFDKISTIKVGEKELDRAKRYIIGKHDISLQKNSAISSSILFDVIYGLKEDNFQNFAEQIKSLSSEDILLTAQKIFSQKSVTSIVGPD